MIGFIMIQKGTPEIINLLGLLLGILLCLFALNAFIEWLMTKPWIRNKPPDETISENQTENNCRENTADDIDQFDKHSEIAGEQPFPLTSG